MAQPRLAPRIPTALAALALALLAAAPAPAAPRPYALTGATRVAFQWDFGPDAMEGRMGIAGADLRLDLDHVAGSSVAVSVDVTGAEAGFPFATEAMKGPRVLDAARFPTIDFVSRSVTQTGDGTARIEGDVTVRGVTRPMALDASLYGDVSDLSHLTIRLTGLLHRSEFGASGWSDMVGDEVRLDIQAEIAAAG